MRNVKGKPKFEPVDWAFIAAICFLILVFFYNAWPKSAKAHDWYSNLMRPDQPTISCCGGYDCGPTEAEYKRDGWQAVVNGQWVAVPETKIVKTPSKDGKAHVCAPKEGTNMYCFIPPSMGS